MAFFLSIICSYIQHIAFPLTQLSFTLYTESCVSMIYKIMNNEQDDENMCILYLDVYDDTIFMRCSHSDEKKILKILLGRMRISKNSLFFHFQKNKSRGVNLWENVFEKYLMIFFNCKNFINEFRDLDERWFFVCLWMNRNLLLKSLPKMNCHLNVEMGLNAKWFIVDFIFSVLESIYQTHKTTTHTMREDKNFIYFYQD